MKKFDLGQIRSAMAIVGVVLSIIYFPVNSKFAAMGREIDNNFSIAEKEFINIKYDLKKHCEDSKEAYKEFADLGETNIKLDQICKDLARLFDAFEKCREQDERTRDAIQDLITKLPHQ